MIGRDRPRTRTLPLALLGALALIVVMERRLTRRSLDFATPAAVQYLAAVDGLHLGRDAEIICFGDSVIKMGVLPRVIGERTGWPAYNHALLGGQPMSGYFLLRRALDRGEPKAILVGYTPCMLQIDPRAATRGLNEIVRPAEMLDFAWTARDARLFAAMLAARVVPSYRAREEVRANIAQALRGDVPTTRWANVLHLRNWTVNRGSQVSPPPSVRAVRADPTVEAAAAKAWNIHPLNAAYVKRFLELADSRGIPVYWLVSPIRGDAQARQEQLGVDAHHSRFLRRLQAAFPRVTVVDGRRSGYGSTLFSDPVHLHGAGAAAYSEALAEVLAGSQDAPEGPRWVDLPPYRHPRKSAAVENMAQSLEALRAPATRLR